MIFFILYHENERNIYNRRRTCRKILLFFLYIACYISYNMLFNFITPRPIGNKDTICIYNSTHDWKTRENQNIYG